MPIDLKQADLTRWPWRGALTAVARRLSTSGTQITRQAVRQQLARGNREMIRLINEELARREKLIEGGTR